MVTNHGRATPLLQLVAGSDAILGAEGCLPLLVGGRVAADVDEDEDAAFGFSARDQPFEAA